MKASHRKGRKMTKKKKKTADELFLDAVKQSRPRPLMPSPKIYKDRTKYDRNKAKEEIRREIEEEE